PATAVVAEDHPWLDRLRRPGEHSHHDADVSPNALGVPNSAPAQAPRERINGQKHSDASLPLAPTLPVAGAGAWGEGAVNPGACQDALDREDRGRPGASAIPPGDPPSIGRYRVIGVLGEGGFGRVYRAHDAELDRDVAIKVPVAGQAGPYLDVE